MKYKQDWNDGLHQEALSGLESIIHSVDLEV